jgi:M6 family metalloprotease-like protein
VRQRPNDDPRKGPLGAMFRVPPREGEPTPLQGLRPLRNELLLRFQHRWIARLRRWRDWRFSHAPQQAPGASGGDSFPVSGAWKPTAVTGQRRLLMVLINFTDAKLQPGAVDYWQQLAFGASSASVANYFRDNSYNKVSIVPVAHTQAGAPAGVVTVTLPMRNPDYGGNFTLQDDEKLIQTALDAVAAYVNVAALDADGDGTVAVDEALFYFVLAGYEAGAANGLSPSVWAHRWGSDRVQVQGKHVDNWALSGEMFDATHPMQMGVVAHEMGHAMGGLPDLYDVAGSNVGLGPFSLMSYGSWGARKDEQPGTTPVALDAWTRQYLGWSEPRVLSPGETSYFPSSLATVHSAGILADAQASTSEYWLIENRPPVGWDAGLWLAFQADWPGGLLIQHIDNNVGKQTDNSFNESAPGAHQGNVAVESPASQCHLLVDSSSPGCPSLLFSAPAGSAFAAQAERAPQYYSGAALAVGLTDISQPGALMRATVVAPPGRGAAADRAPATSGETDRSSQAAGADR